jgi:RNA polymerase sigma factor (TIGR02999 family)
MDVTGLLRAWSGGDPAALHAVTPILYAELKRIARRHLARERPGHTLQPTALIHEAFLKLMNAAGVDWHDRAHFFAVSTRIMRRILVNHALARGAGKRGACALQVTLDDKNFGAPLTGRRLVALDEALNQLAKLDPRKAQAVELRFFGGLSVQETAAVLKVSPQTVLRDWTLAKSWLAREMSR